MTHWKTYAFDSSNFDRFFIGADKLAKSLKEGSEWLANNAASYPPFNLKKVDDNKYMIEMAVAGFTKQDIELTLEDNTLVIKGNATGDTDAEKPEYLHYGIANRAFTRRFTLADNVEIHNAELINGMLKVWLEHMIPEEKKPRKIEVKETASK
jgi:molecular chaperone IbpA